MRASGASTASSPSATAVACWFVHRQPKRVIRCLLRGDGHDRGQRVACMQPTRVAHRRADDSSAGSGKLAIHQASEQRDGRGRLDAQSIGSVARIEVESLDVAGRQRQRFDIGSRQRVPDGCAGADLDLVERPVREITALHFLRRQPLLSRVVASASRPSCPPHVCAGAPQHHSLSPEPAAARESRPAREAAGRRA
jgi:hypothetical protein